MSNSDPKALALLREVYTRLKTQVVPSELPMWETAQPRASPYQEATGSCSRPLQPYSFNATVSVLAGALIPISSTFCNQLSLIVQNRRDPKDFFSPHFPEMKVTLISRGGREIINGGIQINDSATVADLQEKIYRKTKKYHPSRQRLMLSVSHGSKEKAVILDREKTLKDYFDGTTSNLVVVFKDLGPQVSYRTLFLWEYLGPLIIYPMIYYLPVYKFFGYKEEHAIYPVQTYALYYWCFHYSKRILETFFVHRFSHTTSPVSNIFRNCAYYWTFGAYIAYHVNHPLYTPVGEHQMMVGFGMGIVFQVANFYCHVLLRNLRSPDGSGGYQIPRGFLFNIVTCANYTTEIYQWLGFNIATQTIAGYVFLVVAALIMTNWALSKHRRLKKVFNGRDGRAKYPNRWVILPPFF